MPNPYRSGRRPRARKLRTIEVIVLLMWLAQSAIPLALVRRSKTIAANFSYISSGVALIVLAISIPFQMEQIFTRRRNVNQLDLIFRMVLMFAAAIVLSLFAVGVGMLLNFSIQTESFIVATLLWMDLAVIVFCGLVLDNSFEDILVVFAWLILAILAGVQLSESLVLSSVLYSSVLILWTYYYQLCDMF